jgi:hypothetical protein
MDKGSEELNKILEEIKAMSPKEFVEWYNSVEVPEDFPEIVID